MEGGLVELCLGEWDRRAEKVGEDLGGQERENMACLPKGKARVPLT